jgi:hypothetical protein
MSLEQETQARDAALDLLEQIRVELVHEAKRIAFLIASSHGKVTSVQVHRELWLQHQEAMQGVDPRFLGCVFRDGGVWERLGWESTGSHRRPVAVWGLRGGSR